MREVEPTDWLRWLRLTASLLVIGFFTSFLLAMRIDQLRCAERLPACLPPGVVIVDRSDGGYLDFVHRCTGGSMDCYRLVASDGERTWDCYLGKGMTQGGPPPTTQGLSIWLRPTFPLFHQGASPPEPPVPRPFTSSISIPSSKTSMIQTA